MHIQILNWSKFNPRKDVKRTHWFRLDNDFVVRMYGFSSGAKVVWLCLLSEASRNQNGFISVDVRLIAATMRCKRSVVESAIKQFEAAGMIEIVPNARDADVTPTSRGRNVDVTPTSRGRNATGQDITEQNKDTTELGVIESPRCEERVLEIRDLPEASDDAGKAPKKSKPKSPDGSLVWEAYKAAYLRRYETEPVRNAKANTICSRLVKEVGLEKAMALVEFYLGSENQFYLRRCHDLGIVSRDIQPLLTQMATGIVPDQPRQYQPQRLPPTDGIMRIEDIMRQKGLKNVP